MFLCDVAVRVKGEKSEGGPWTEKPRNYSEFFFRPKFLEEKSVNLLGLSKII